MRRITIPLTVFLVAVVVLLIGIGIGQRVAQRGQVMQPAEAAAVTSPAINAPTALPTLEPTVTLAPTNAPTSTQAPSPTNAPTEANTSTAVAQEPTAEAVMDWVNHPKLYTGDQFAIWTAYQDLAESDIRNDCYGEGIRATVPVTDVLDFGARAVIKVYPPNIWDDNAATLTDDGKVVGHVRLTQGDTVVERDFTNDIEIPCMAAGRWRIEITGTYYGANGVEIVFDNAGSETNFRGTETDNPWRYFVIERGKRSTFGWYFNWIDDWKYEQIN